MGRPKKYTPESLRRAVKKYFLSITREKTVQERVPTGKKDGDGHEIYEMKPVVNQLGDEMTVIEYVIPPSVGGLCQFLGIHRSTWSEWAKDEEFSDTVMRAQGRMQAWNEEQLLTRPGKDLKGIVFNLENNYGYREKSSVEVTGGIEELMKKLADEEGAAEF